MKTLLTILLFCCTLSQAQQPRLVYSEDFKATKFIGFDAYKNVYFTKEMVLHKNGPTGTFQFNDFQLGAIASVDIINPLNVVVFYDDTNTVVLLDNRLTEIERINFNQLPEFINVGTATNAGGNRLWIFNTDTQQLELYNYRNGKKTEISQPITENLKWQASNFNYCYLLTEKRVRVYNIYGGIVNELAIDSAEKIIQQNENFVMLKNNQLDYYKEKETTNLPLKTPEIIVEDLQLTQDFLYIYDGKKLHTFALNQPKN